MDANPGHLPSRHSRSISTRLAGITLCASLCASCATGPISKGDAEIAHLPHTTIAALADEIEVGDIIFIRVGSLPFRQVALATQSWSNHTAIVIARGPLGVQVSESRFPLSGTTSLTRFVARSEGGRVAVMRMNEPLSAEQRERLVSAARAREGIFYDTGFDLQSRREFCSRFVREVVEESSGRELGRVETFVELLQRQPDTDLWFWRLWYFGSIPWERTTVTPASILSDPQLHAIFDGRVSAQASS